MHKLMLCGLNYKTATLALRERCAFSESTVARLLADILTETVATQALVLVTCNRTEIYTDSDQGGAILGLVQQYSGLERVALENCYYEYRGQIAVEHLLRVAAGMDSMVVGETEIFSQVKKAFALAQAQGAMATEFKNLAQMVFKVAKSVRTSCQIGMCPVSIASLATRQAVAELGDVQNHHALVIGSGVTSKLLAQYVRKFPFKQLTIAARNLAAAEEIAALCEANVISLSELHDFLPQVDVVLSATASQLPVLGKGAVESALQVRGQKPLVLVDMAVPRDIEKEVAELAAVCLITIDDLKDMAADNVSIREHSLAKAETLITHEAGQFMRYLHGCDATPSLKAFYAKATTMRERELKKCHELLAKGASVEETLDYLSRSITNKLLHEPSLMIRYADRVNHAAFQDFVRELFK